jgi:hypothetical protein
VIASEKAKAAWKNATARLRAGGGAPGGLAGLEAVGERGGRLVLVDLGAAGARPAIAQRRRAAALVAPLGYRGVEIFALPPARWPR